jgi:dynein heavy chain
MHTDYLRDHLVSTLDRFDSFTIQVEEGLAMPVDDGDNVGNLRQVMRDILETTKAELFTMDMFPPLKECLALLRHHQVDMGGEKIPSKGEVRRREKRGKPDDWVPDGPPDLSKSKVVADYLDEAPMIWEGIVKTKYAKKDAIAPIKMQEEIKLKEELNAYYEEMRAFRGEFRGNAPFAHQGTAEEAYAEIDVFAKKLEDFATRAADFNKQEELFELPVSKYPELPQTLMELRLLRALWDFKAMVMFTYDGWKRCAWDAVDTDKLESQNKTILKTLRANGNNDQIIKQWQVFRDIEDAIKNMQIVLPLINDLHSDALQNRHWKALARVCSVAKVEPTAEGFSLGDMMALKLHTRVEEVQEVVETAQKEKKIEKKLADISGAWKEFQIDYRPHKATEVSLISLSEEVLEALDAHMLELQTMLGMGKFVEFFKAGVEEWQVKLSNVQSTISVWEKVSRSWASLESIFLSSADIRASLSDVTKIFEGIDAEFKAMMQESCTEFNVIAACNVDGKEQALTEMKKGLDKCQRALNEYLDVKKAIYPRFYFVSAVALLDMLANGTVPKKIMPYLGDCYDALANLIFIKDEATGEESNKTADIMVAKDRERIPMHEPFTMEGEVELYLNRLTDAMQITLRHQMLKGIEDGVNWETSEELPRHKWCFKYPAQVVLTGSLIYWTEETEQALEELEGGKEDAVKLTYQNSLTRLGYLIQLVLGELTSGDRCKIITFITMDVHGRDVLKLMVDSKIEGPGAFMWQQQLRFYWEHDVMDVNIRICDFKTKYFYEWTGNVGRLVITALTDRCYITLTMGLRLFLGGAPAGPAGTGKTETTKDLARALALPCYVFNCSDQMNYQSMADIFRGLAQTGAWGCFDEFNRISIEVLSVVATQVKTVQDAIVKYAVPSRREEQYQHLSAGTPPNKVGKFDFFGTIIDLIPTCGFWITMNPGYAGRTPLPENLKALFRSCAMIRPDLKPICENMLMSEGFQTAQKLAIKFVTLYALSGELLSKQAHYDWGLRAVKSVLRVAGKMKRAEPDLEEAQILMRALRDFNTPKIPAVDTPIFLRLISDLFMGLEVPVKVDEGLKQRIVRVANDTGIQYDDIFILKTCQFQELLDVRHSVMLLGPAGCGKTEIWKCLAGTHNLDKPKKTCVYETVNPKSVSGDELYGYMTLSKDWKDGCLSIIMRGMAKNFAEQSFYEYQTYKWAVLDGDIDAVWIESMNTVMDDNKVLTLVSNERVPLSDAMRMVFEINSLKNATPATVSRAGILYINESDIGWRPFVETWLADREKAELMTQIEAQNLLGLFDKYVDSTAAMTRKGFKKCTPIYLMNQVQTTVYLLEAQFDAAAGVDMTLELMEKIYVFCHIWAFGGPMIIDKQTDFRKRFSDDFKQTFPTVLYPPEGDVFDYYFDSQTDQHVHWRDSLEKYVPEAIGSGPGETAFMALNVETVDSKRTKYLIDVLMRRGRNVMLVGTAGTGKTATINKYLNGLDKDTDGLLSYSIVMSYFTDSAKLQVDLELPIDKRAGRMFGPPTGKKLIYFIDDLNLPYIETYGTQNSIALLTQLLQHGTIFDRADLGFRKEIVDVQIITAMNPTSGSFEICERGQIQFATFSCAMPSTTDLQTIYEQIFNGHVERFDKKAKETAPFIVSASIGLIDKVAAKFLPTSVRFTYFWTMREMTNLFQNMCLAKDKYYGTGDSLAKLWCHECRRVLADRLITIDETKIIDDMIGECHADHLKKQGVSADVLLNDAENANIYTTFTATEPDGAYRPIADLAQLSKVLEAKLVEYNESNAMMDLVLFDDAMSHISRIARIISNPAGNAMLIGVGGSGKQSLTKLAAFICGYETKQLEVTSAYSENDFKEDIKLFYTLCCSKDTPMVLLMTDSQIVNDRFLIYINALLSAGWVSDLLAKDELDAITGSLRNEMKANAPLLNPDDPNDAQTYMIQKFRIRFKLVLAFSPVGDTFRIRARRFPGLINCTAIDYFHPWPHQALVSVANRFLADVELEDESLKGKLALHMALEHLSVGDASAKYAQTQRRYNYVTPKSYLELIGFYKYVFGEKRQDIQRQIDRLDVGLSTLKKTSTDVAELKIDLERTMVMVEEKKSATDALIIEMGISRNIAEKEGAAANIEAEKAGVASAAALEVKTSAEAELAEAEPAMQAAADAVACLTKNMLGELKSLPKPPAGVEKVTACCLILLEHEYKQHLKWDRAKKMMGNVDAFMTTLQEYDGRTMPENEIPKVEVFVKDPEMTVDAMKKKSAAAANLWTWVVNIYGFNRIYVKVKPLMDALDEANASKAAADESLAAAQATVKRCEDELQALQDKFEAATAEKQEVEEMAEACLEKLGLAERLVGGLASENERWGREIEEMKVSTNCLIGDCMVAAGFVSYVGAFDQKNREALWKTTWLEDLKQNGVPMSETVDPLPILVTDSQVARMVGEGLPEDRISTENGAIITCCKRWPLIIDPQVQGIKWLKQKQEKDGFVPCLLTQKNWIRAMRGGISDGMCVIIENLGEEIDATLDPVLSRAIYKKGSSLYIKFGGEEMNYDPAFSLYMQTRLDNPHYKPEIAAQCTLINFIATERGLEDQLLAKTVGEERPDLEAETQRLNAEATQYKIQLLDLEDQLLERLANAPDDILSDIPLIEGLEATKKTSKEIQAALAEGAKVTAGISVAREVYRKQASEGAMLYFMLTRMCAVDHMYQYSLDSFVTFFLKSIAKATAAPKIEDRVANLVTSLRMTIFTWVARGLFTRHKLIFLSVITFGLMKRGTLGEDNLIDPVLFDFLLKGPKKTSDENPLQSWLPRPAWEACQALADLDDFGKLPADLVEAAPRFREWYNHATPESEKLPLDWSQLDRPDKAFKKMLVVRSLRPDRMVSHLANFLRTTMPAGGDYVDCDSTLNSVQILRQSLADSTPQTPIYFILSPGADVVADLDKIAAEQDPPFVNGENYFNVSMGQGQDVIAMSYLESAHRNGSWVILNNIHLMPKWLLELEKKLDSFGDHSHDNFRLFLSSDPAKNIPIGILNRCIKLTNEPPGGLKANLVRAFCFFSKESFEELDSKTKSILFGLCHFHAVMMERKLYGPMGYNMMYPFAVGDLRDSAVILSNYMENSGGGKIPWMDLKYLFGEIMYGGHIVNDFDRLTCKVYLDFFMKDELLDETEMYPYSEEEKGVSFMCPAPTSYDNYLKHINATLTSDTPVAFGLHPNAEIDFRTTQSEGMFKTLVELQPRSAGDDEGGGMSPTEVAAAKLDDIMERFGEKKFDIDDLDASLDETGPFQNSFLQEMEVMNRLLAEIVRSLKELTLGFKGELSMSDAMEAVCDALFMDEVPPKWSKISWASMKALSGWLANFTARLGQLEEWAGNPTEIPKCTWLSYLINPQSFLTSVNQVAAQKNQWELDKLVTFTDVTKWETHDKVDSVSRDGAYVCGFNMQGARWDTGASTIDRSKPKEMFFGMPVLSIRGLSAEKADFGNMYMCPVYKTEFRGPTFVFCANLKTKSAAGRWTLAGVALIMELTA